MNHNGLGAPHSDEEQGQLIIEGLHLQKLLNVAYPHVGGTSLPIKNVFTDPANARIRSDASWLVNTLPDGSNEQYGLSLIYWPNALSKIVWDEQAANYLRRTGHSIRKLQRTSFYDPIVASKQVSIFKDALLALLPPGALIEPEAPFMRVFLRDALAHQTRGNLPSDFYDQPVTAWMQPWSVFRWEGLSLTSEKSIADAVQRHKPLSGPSICKISDTYLDQCPSLIKFLFEVLRLAYDNPGHGWTHYGLAWTKAGLVFNYELAAMSLIETKSREKGYLKQFGLHNLKDTLYQWRDPAYLLSKTPLTRLPALGEIIFPPNKGARSYIDNAIRPHALLFEGADPLSCTLKSCHDSEHTYLFPLAKKYKKTLIAYAQALFDLSTRRDQALKAPVVTTPKTTTYKAPAEGLLLSPNKHTARALALQAPLRTPARRAKADLPKTYRASFEARHLSSTLEPPPGFEHTPFDIDICTYRGNYYFGFSQQIHDTFPEVNLAELYDNNPNTRRMRWTQDVYQEHIWHGHLNKVSGGDNKRALNVVDFTLPTVNEHLNRVRVLQGKCFLNPELFRPGGVASTLLRMIVERRPYVSAEMHDHVQVFLNFWQWIYEPLVGVKMGMYVEEFAYPIGQETTHCPEDAQLLTLYQRLNFVIDKAEHCLDGRVCQLDYLESDESTKRSPRSKWANSYDDFLAWHVDAHEIPLLAKSPEEGGMGVRLDRMERAFYISQRWMPWRRKMGVYKQLKKLPFPEGGYSRPDMDKVLAFAKEHFRPPYTTYDPYAPYLKVCEELQPRPFRREPEPEPEENQEQEQLEDDAPSAHAPAASTE